MSKELDKSMTFLLRHYIFHTVGITEQGIADVIESIKSTLREHHGYTDTEMKRYNKKYVDPLLTELCVVMEVPDDEREDAYFGKVDPVGLADIFSSETTRCCWCCAGHDKCITTFVGSGCPVP